MRGFFGFPLLPSIAEELAAFGRGLGGKPLLAPDLHVTIKFLSEFSQDAFVRVLPELCALGPPPEPALRAGAISQWPTVIALELEAPPELARWQGEVNRLLERRGFIHERHPEYRPHITLVRGVGLLDQASTAAFRGREIALAVPALYRSEHEESGRRHRELMSVLSEGSKLDRM